jgi:hypothetical protein
LSRELHRLFLNEIKKGGEDMGLSDIIYNLIPPFDTDEKVTVTDDAGTKYEVDKDDLKRK